MKKESVWPLIFIVFLACVYAVLTNLKMIGLFLYPESGVEIVTTKINQAKKIDLDAKLIFQLANKENTETPMVLTMVSSFDQNNKSFNINISSPDQLIPEIGINKKDNDLGIEIPGMYSETIQWNELFPARENSTNLSIIDTMKKFIATKDGSYKVKYLRLSSNILTKNEKKRDQKEWVYVIKLDSTLDVLAQSFFPGIMEKADESSKNNETNSSSSPNNSNQDPSNSKLINDLELYISENLSKLKNMNVEIDFIMNTDLEPKLYEITINNTEGKTIMSLSGNMTFSR